MAARGQINDLGPRRLISRSDFRCCCTCQARRALVNVCSSLGVSRSLLLSASHSGGSVSWGACLDSRTELARVTAMQISMTIQLSSMEPASKRSHAARIEPRINGTIMAGRSILPPKLCLIARYISDSLQLPLSKRAHSHSGVLSDDHCDGCDR